MHPSTTPPKERIKYTDSVLLLSPSPDVFDMEKKESFFDDEPDFHRMLAVHPAYLGLTPSFFTQKIDHNIKEFQEGMKKLATYYNNKP